MQTDIEIATETVLAFLREIPMSASTVKYYRSHPSGRFEGNPIKKVYRQIPRDGIHVTGSDDHSIAPA